MAKLINKNSEEFTVTPTDKEKGFTLDQMYSLIGCSCVEPIYFQDGSGRVMWVDEEGLLKGLEYNLLASYLIGRQIVGSVLITRPSEVQ